MSRYDAYKLDTPDRFEEPHIVAADPDDPVPIDLDDEPYPGSDDLDDMPGPDALACDHCGEPAGTDYQQTAEAIVCRRCIRRAGL